ncbi:metalloproteinase inhibitor 2-like [Hippocampus comes]|uniref:Metalloproteinase inhibitor 2-like n=1 Tax=Hippocampus comes TaxID=109280 RepID=A0A3Q3DHS3_HIPCM|nr:PREDICTED: metalloproteinase inhibitor 2-like [Hippocampus comes]
MTWQYFVLPLVLLCLWGLQEEGAQACSCLPMHPQQVFCQKDVVVIRAKVVGVTHATPVKRLTKYDIEQTKYFKGSKKRFRDVYTAPSSAACGVTLTNGVEYLLMGRLEPDRTLRMVLCDFYKPWSALSSVQRVLLYRYDQGCHCTIKSCFSYPCCITGSSVCLWRDVLEGKMGNGEQAQNAACIRKKDGSCGWHYVPSWPPQG